MGAPNYMTPQGLKKLRAELKHLLEKERPAVVKTVSWAAEQGDRSENADYIYGKRRLREIDRRIHFLQRRLDHVEVVDPASVNSDRVMFGATVTVVDEEGQKAVYQIVGADEFDVNAGRISWESPLAKALLGRRKGDTVVVKRPKGAVTLTVVQIEYK